MSNFECEKRHVFENVPGANLGAPGHHHRVKKLVFQCTVVQNRVSSFSRWGASRRVLEAKMEPKWRSESTQKLAKTHLENQFEFRSKCKQNDGKMASKMVPKCSKFRIRILTFFFFFNFQFSRPGQLGGRRVLANPLATR